MKIELTPAEMETLTESIKASLCTTESTERSVTFLYQVGALSAGKYLAELASVNFKRNALDSILRKVGVDPDSLMKEEEKNNEDHS